MDSNNWFPVFKDYYDPLMAGSIDGTDTEPHDHGISRALTAKYRPNKGVQGDPRGTLFVTRLHPKMTDEELKEHFNDFEVIKATIIRDIVTGYSRCYGFVEFTTEREADKAYREAKHWLFPGMDMIVEHEWERVMKGWVPRRLGGGVGGRKESGQLRFGGSVKPFKRPIRVNEGTVDNSNQRDTRYTPTTRDRDPGRTGPSDWRKSQDRRGEHGRDRYRESRDYRRRSRSRSRERDRGSQSSGSRDRSNSRRSGKY